MKKALAWLLVLAMTAALAVGGTLAYLTDTDEDVNVMTVGKVKIDQLEYERVDVESKDKDATVQEFRDNKPLYPAVTEKGFDYTPGDAYVDWGQIGKDGYTSDIWDPTKINNEVDKMVFVKNKGDYNAFVRSVFAFEAGKYTNLTDYLKDVHLNLNETEWTWNWGKEPVTIGGSKYFVATATYNMVLAPGALTEISLSQIALDSSVTNEVVEAFGDTYQVLVQSQAVQADGFENYTVALDEAFGSVPTAEGKYPFESDSPIKGIDLRTALHYLNGNIQGTKITANVSNVIFGLNKDYAKIVNTYDGVLVDVEQDVPVYAYYVPNGAKYDVYFLANGTIYSPKDSNHLFAYMTSLRKVDTGNFDVSRVVNARRMFRNCEVMTDIDVSKWDTSKITDMNAMFYRNYLLTDVAVGDWDVGNVTDMNFTFYYCKNLETLDVANWDVRNVVGIESFLSSGKDNVGDMKIRALDLTKWETPNLTSMAFMFYGCGQLTEMDLSHLNVSKVRNFNHLFTDNYKLQKVDFTGWDTSSTTIFAAMFNNCESLKTVDVSSFDTQNGVYFSQMFEYCYNLEKIIGLENWDTSSATDFYEMFNCCYSLKELDLSSFNTSKVSCTTTTFAYCSSLKTIYVGDGWGMSNVTEGAGSIFIGCNSLVGGAGTSFANHRVTDVSYAKVDGGADAPGYLTYKAPVNKKT